MTWIHDNSQQLLQGAGLLYAILVIVNGLLPFNSGPRKWLSWFLDRVSPFVRKDSPGTLKLPILASSKEPAPDGKLQELTPPKGFATDSMMLFMAWAVLVGSCLVLLGNCAWAQHAKADVIQCSKEEITKLASEVLPDITSILLAGVAGWQAELASIASKVGEDVVGCVVAKLASGWTPPPGTAAALPPAAVRAYEYLNTQPKTFKL